MATLGKEKLDLDQKKYPSFPQILFIWFYCYSRPTSCDVLIILNYKAQINWLEGFRWLFAKLDIHLEMGLVCRWLFTQNNDWEKSELLDKL